jgi:WD repeat-containing protein 48
VLPLPNATAGHRLGVNGLAVDHERSILYSAGRDGVIYSWNAPDDVTSQPKSSPQNPLHSYRQHVQAHTHWINDIVLAHNGQALVSGSSDNSVKIWRPHAQDSTPPQIIGSHSDYVKCLASPGQQSSWVASGGLDKKIYLWDLQHGEQKSVIQNVTEDTTIADKGAIYALCANENLLASGGPESVVKIWDSRTSKRVTKFLGHTDNIRSILISQDSNTVMTASSDQSIKIWSLTAGRCLHTLTMHTDSVWCLESDHPHLSTFYSGDRSGLIAKTDLRGAADVDDGLSVSLVQEHDGICKIASTQTSIWTATAGSSVNRWADVDTSVGVQLPDSMRNYRFGNSHGRARSSSSVQVGAPNGVSSTKIPLTSVLRISNTASFPPSQPRTATERSVSGQSMAMRKPSTAFVEPEVVVPASSLQAQPVDTIQGQNGLIKHILLNDRRRVLTTDTAGEVMLWDLIRVG